MKTTRDEAEQRYANGETFVVRQRVESRQKRMGWENTFPDGVRRVYATDEVVDYEAEWLKAIGE